MKTRRTFLKSVSAVSAGISMLGIEPLFAENFIDTTNAETKRKIYIFSKHLQWLAYSEMAELAHNVGFDGVDLTVRPNGHVLPERVKTDLPKAVQALKSNSLLANRMTTAITKADDPLTHDILETAASLGIKNYRMGWFAYNQSITVQQNIENFNSELRKFEKLNKKLGLKAAYQNHAGEMCGGPVWDIGLMLEGIDPEYVGVRYDIRHATVEGGTSWPVGMKFLAKKINSFDVKDFYWKETDGKWAPFNVPLGNGMVDFNRYFELIKKLNIEGDFTIHLEYPLGGAEHGASKLTCDPEKVISAMKNDLATLKKYV